MCVNSTLNNTSDCSYGLLFVKWVKFLLYLKNNEQIVEQVVYTNCIVLYSIRCHCDMHGVLAMHDYLLHAPFVGFH